jgi:hypothetical protein
MKKEEGSSATSNVRDVTDVTDVKDRRKKEKNSYLFTRHLRVLLLGIGNWELGIGNWELWIFLRPSAISFHRLPITDYPLPNLSCRTAASVWLTKS